MKIWIISLVILIAFLTLGCWTEIYFNNTSKQLSLDLERIETHITQKKWTHVFNELESFKNQWIGYKKILSILVHHQEIDRLEEALTKTIQAVKSHSYPDSLIEIGALKHYINHVSQKEVLNFTNVL